MSARTALARQLHRAAMYRLCAIALAYPSPGRFAEVAAAAERIVDAAAPPLRARVRALAAAARAASEAEAAAEYVALFHGAARCIPCEGAYGPVRMAGKSAELADIAGFYAAFGMEPSAGEPEIEDHVATELEFMSALALKEAWALAEAHYEHAEISADATAAFLRDHLARWIPAFAAALDGATTAPYYRAVAALLTAWVAQDVAALGVTVEPLPTAAATPAAAEPFACPMAGEQPADA
ncbi:MAG: molecular chaperone TorD family protein [Candidatus Rokubacteria bacterium]|nr:molecular chaperone TorD family protein [Candidatus Rokubacteria bacterium]